MLRSARDFGLFAYFCLCAAGCIDVVPQPETFASWDGHWAASDALDAASADVANSVDSATPVDTDVHADDTALPVDGSSPGTDSVAIDTTTQDTDTADSTADVDAAIDGGTVDAGPVDPCAGKKDKEACDDGDPCTIAVCDAGKCVEDANKCECYVAADCAKKDDGDACTGTLYCDTAAEIHTCKINPATVVKCTDDGNPCTTTACDKKTGACTTQPVPDVDPKKPCEDGNKCTASDFCEKGQCQSGVVVCTCVKQADCASQEDGNACNGTLFCDNSGPKPTCKLNPASIVTCPTASNDGCTNIACNIKTGACESTVSKDLSACDDGDACTSGDTCDKGVCKPGTDLCQCKKDADCSKFDDGDACNGTLYCHLKSGACKPNPKTVVTCAKGTDCYREVCNPNSGKCEVKHPQKFTPCNADGNPCTVDDTCDGKGNCDPGTDVCVCEENADCAKNEDGNPCTGTLYCDKLAKPPTCKPNPKTVVTCPAPANTCELNLCSAKTGKCEIKKVADFTPCSDGDNCTVGDVCESGMCKAGTDLCACTSDTDCLDDGNLCNGVPYCDKTVTPTVCKTKGNSAISCSSPGGSGCVLMACVPKTGKCVATPTPSSCPEGGVCEQQTCSGNPGKCGLEPLIDDSPVPKKNDEVCLAGKPQKVVSGMELVAAQKLPMGCNKVLDSGCEEDEKPQHDVALAAFWIDRFEVTVTDYKACADKGNCPALTATDKGCNHTDPKRVLHPINCVSHQGAQSYCKHVGKRLPTEAEWEAAARGGCGKYPEFCAAAQPQFPWGLSVGTCDFAVIKSDAGDGCGLGTTRSIGTFVKDESPWDVRDMAGNVAEWVSDWYAADYYKSSPAVDPAGPVTATARVVRGGHFQGGASGARAGNRSAVKPDVTSPTIGFRCARDL